MPNTGTCNTQRILKWFENDDQVDLTTIKWIDSNDVTELSGRNTASLNRGIEQGQLLNAWMNFEFFMCSFILKRDIENVSNEIF